MRVKTFAIGLSVCAFIALAAQPSDAARPTNRIHAGPGWGDCVRTVRALSDFTIRGDAWTWWNNAAGEHARDNRPQVGSVLVFKRTSHMGRGHVSLVSGVVDKRTVQVDHTWIAGRGVKRGMEVVDVSPNNDWSAVRVWHGPTDQLGQRVYPTYGFILPEGAQPRGDILQVADRDDAGLTAQRFDDGAPAAVAPKGRKPQRKPTVTESPAFGRMFSPLSVSAALAVPPRKPVSKTQAVAFKADKAPVAAAGRKPASRVSVKKDKVLVPARKPKAA